MLNRQVNIPDIVDGWRKFPSPWGKVIGPQPHSHTHKDIGNMSIHKKHNFLLTSLSSIRSFSLSSFMLRQIENQLYIRLRGISQLDAISFPPFRDAKSY